MPTPSSTVIYATPGQVFAAEDRALAKSRGALWLTDTRIARLVAETIRDGEHVMHFYESQAWVVMPNHVHLLILPRVSLPQITRWIKGRTAREANRLLGRTGQPFWEPESYDHWVRSEKELHQIEHYIEQNPVAAGLAIAPEDWLWSSATNRNRTS